MHSHALTGPCWPPRRRWSPSSCWRCRWRRARPPPGGGPVIVLETVKGTIEIETYPGGGAEDRGADRRAGEAELLQRPALPPRRAQLPDPGRRSADARHGDARLVGARRAAATRLASPRSPRSGATCAAPSAMAHRGTDARAADSQFYILTRPHADFDGKYTVFGQVIKGMEVVDKIQVADILKQAFVGKERDGKQPDDAPRGPGSARRTPRDTRRAAAVRAGASGWRRWRPTSPRSDCWRRDTPSSPRAPRRAASANGCSSAAE